MAHSKDQALMKCPHCGVALLRGEPSNLRCYRCQHVVALDPQANTLGLDDLRFQQLAAQLSRDGQLRYTAAQLHHYASQQAMLAQQPPPASLLVVSLCALLSGMLVGTRMSVLAGAVVALLALALGLVLHAWVRPPRAMRLPISLEQFQREVIGRWQKVHGGLPLGLIDSRLLRSLQYNQPAPEQMRAVLACPERAILDCLRANGLPARLGLGLVPTAPPFTPAEQATLATLQARPQLPLLLLHDASPVGCLLAWNVVQALGVQAGQVVYDLGLHPRQAIDHRLLRLYAASSVELMGLLRQHNSLHSPPTALSTAELDWLAQGWCSPILAIPPARLIHVVTRAVERATQSLPQGDTPLDPEQHARLQARAVGFMTWPGE